MKRVASAGSLTPISRGAGSTAVSSGGDNVWQAASTSSGNKSARRTVCQGWKQRCAEIVTVMAHLGTTNESYGILAPAFPWVFAAFGLVQLGLGLFAASLPVSLARLQWLSRHKSLGLAIL